MRRAFLLFCLSTFFGVAYAAVVLSFRFVVVGLMGVDMAHFRLTLTLLGVDRNTVPSASPCTLAFTFTAIQAAVTPVGSVPDHGSGESLPAACSSDAAAG